MLNSRRLVVLAILLFAAGSFWLYREAFAPLGGSMVSMGALTEPAPDASSVSIAAPSPGNAVSAAGSGRLEKAVFAGGCFWSTELAFDGVPGVVATTSGYTGGDLPNPSYRQVTSGGTGHVEAVEVLFDPARVSYDALLDTYWHNVDPFVSRGQFCDYGEQYRPVIFPHDAAQQSAAETSRDALQHRFAQRIAVSIEPSGPFYAADDSHQNFSRRNPARYAFYKWGCGRASRLAEIWQAAGE